MVKHPLALCRRFRFRLRSLFVLLTLVCVVLSVTMWLKNRRDAYLQLAEEYVLGPARGNFQGPPGLNLEKIEFLDKALEDWYRLDDQYREQLYQKYLHAAQHPWVSVAPDPPWPEPPFQGEEAMYSYLQKHGFRESREP